MKRIVITGGSGFVGRALCNRLVRRWPGARLIVPTRDTAHAKAVAMLPTVEAVRCDLSNPRSLAPVLAEADALVHLVAVLHGDAQRFDAVHVQLVRTVAAAARTAGIGRVVHVSALGVAADAPSMYLRSKAAGEAVWRSAFAEAGGGEGGDGLTDGHADTLGPSGLRILRPSVIFGVDDRFTNLFAQLQRLFPVMPLAGAEARFQPVWVEDVAEAIARLLDDSIPGPVVQAAGPQVMTLRQIVEAVGRMADCQRPVLPLPDGLGRLQAAAMGLLPGEPLMSADNLASMQVPNVADPGLPGLAELGIQAAPITQLAPHLAPARAAYDVRG